MAFEKVKRSNYTGCGELACPHTSDHHYEDFQEFHIPMERMHHANLHDWGIARGLEVSGTTNDSKVTIQPGVAIDCQGQLISLASGGQGDIGANPPTESDYVPVPVDLNTNTHKNMTVYVTIQFSEYLDTNDGSGGRKEQRPWLRLQPDPVLHPSDPDKYDKDGSSIILAVAKTDGDGKLVWLKAEDNTVSYRRRIIGQYIEELRLQRSTKVGNKVKDETSGRIGTGDGGGLQITVDIGNTVDINNANFFRIHGHDLILDGRSSGNNRALVDNNNKLIINFNNDYTNGVETPGKMKVGDQLEALANIKLHGQLDALANIKLNSEHGELRDASNRNIGLTYSQKQDLTDGGKATSHKHELGSLGRNGAVGTKVGIISGLVYLKYLQKNFYGDVKINFSNHTYTSTGEGFNSCSVNGYKGSFTTNPHVIIGPSTLGISTYDDTWFDFRYSISSSYIKIYWGVDGADEVNTYNRVQFFIIGPIST